MKVNNKLKIKEFSLLCGVTVKTLRHYEKIGLLQPFEVDEWTGYRYYNVSQMQAMENIRRLKEMGFSLEEIIEMFASGSLKPTLQTLEKKIAESERELHKLQQRCIMLRNLVDSQNKIQKMEQISIQSLPEIIVASHREIISSYNDLGRLCCEVIGAPRANYIDGIWNQEDPEKWLTMIQVPVEKA